MEVPEADIQFQDMSNENVKMAIHSAKIAYLAKKKGESKKGDTKTTRMHWKDCAQMIKQDVEEKLGPTWHCIVGTHFGSFVTHESKNLLFFYIGHMVRIWTWMGVRAPSPSIAITLVPRHEFMHDPHLLDAIHEPGLLSSHLSNC